MTSPSLLRRPAYTLTEILVVISVICVLAALSFTMIRSVLKDANKYDGMVAVAENQIASSKASTKAPPPKKVLLPFAVTPAAPAAPANAGFAPAAAGFNMPAPKKPARPPFVPTELDAVPQEYLITFPASVKDARAEAQRLARQYDGQVLRVYSRIKMACALKIPDNQIAALKADPAARTVEKNYIFQTLAQTTPTGIRRSFSYPVVPPNQLVIRRTTPAATGRNLNFGNKATIGGASIHVAVIDTGIDSTHPDLNVVRSVGFNNIPNGEDENGHGTHVAGTIGARGNSIGVVGVYPGAPLWSLRIFDSAGKTTNMTLLDSLAYVYDNSNVIRVCNMSIGAGAVITIVNDFVDACVLKGVVMIAAAGNAGQPASGWSPASASLVVCVAALADSDGRPGGKGKKTAAGPDDTMADFSNYDYAVDIMAPGVDILSTLPGGGYGLKSGTSMAAPHVAGYVALLLDPNTTFGKTQRNLLMRYRPGAARLMGPYLRSIATEQIPGILGDPLYYPLVNFHVQ